MNFHDEIKRVTEGLERLKQDVEKREKQSLVEFMVPLDPDLIRAIEIGDANQVLLVLGNKHIDINLKTKEGNSTLSLAIYMGHSTVVRLLLAHGVDCKHTVAPLRSAIAKGDLEIVRLLLEFGADVNAKTDSIPCIFLATTIAIIRRNPEILKVVIEAGGDVNEVGLSVGWTPLMWAVREENLDVATLLIEAGADVNACDTYGIPVIRHCRHNSEIIALLKAAGAQDSD